MKNLTVISGPQGTGKTSIAMKHVEGKNSLWCVVKDLESQLRSYLSPDIEIIVIDDFNYPKDVKYIKFLFKDSFSIRQPYEIKSTKFPIPEVVIITNCELTKEELLLNVKDL